MKKKMRVKKEKDRINMFVMDQDSRIYIDASQHGMLVITMRDEYLEVIAEKDAMVQFLRK